MKLRYLVIDALCLVMIALIVVASVSLLASVNELMSLQ